MPDAASPLAYYCRRLTQLKRNMAGGHGAPYKPALLLAVLMKGKVHSYDKVKLTANP